MLLYVLLATLMVGSAFYSGAETALVSGRRARLEQLASEGRRDARRALGLLADVPRTMSVILVGTNLCNIGATALATAIAIGFSPDHGPALATVVLTPILLFGAEILPKAYFRARANRLLRVSSGFLEASAVVFAPIVAVTSATTRMLLFLLPVEDRRPIYRREDLENVFLFGNLREESGEGSGDTDELLRMAGKALDLSRRAVTSALVPLSEEQSCPADATVGDALERFRRGRSRYLASLDAEGRVEGFVTAKQLLGEPEDQPIARHVRSAYLLDDDDTLDEVIQGFRRHQQSIGLVRDRHGRNLGVVTTEDVLEEIVGDLAQIPRSSPGRNRSSPAPEQQD